MNGLPEEKLDQLRELCREHHGIELTKQEAVALGAYLIQLLRVVYELD
jgi:hypothetical protein